MTMLQLQAWDSSVSLKQVLDTPLLMSGMPKVPVARAGRSVGLGIGVASYLVVEVGL